MKIVKPKIEILDNIDGLQILKKIELIGRVCYKSEDKITENSCYKFVEILLSNGHESVIEHVNISVRIICDRGVSHELVRHRIASFSQSSTRYCNYSNTEMEFIEPCFWKNNKHSQIVDFKGKSYIESHAIGIDSLSNDDKKLIKWYRLLNESEKAYNELISLGATPQEARSILPNSLKTEIVITCNLREWRHILKLRCSKKAHPQAREIFLMILQQFSNKIPIIFDDINK